MTRPNAAASQYLQTHVQSRTPLELVVMLYDGAIRWADTAHDAMVADNIPARREALSRLISIVGELRSTLDMERGGEIAENLDRLYGWAIARLTDAVVHRDARPIHEVRRVLTTLREAWLTIASQQPVGSHP
jgi:flagellar secretion chaperone FliS